MNQSRIKNLVALIATVGLAACGGGSSSPAAVPGIASGGNVSAGGSIAGSGSIADAQGLYAGSLTGGTSYDLTGLVLEDGTYYFAYSRAGTIYGLVQGSATGASGSFTSSNAYDFNFASNSRTAASLSGTYAAKTSFNGSGSEASGTSTFQTTYDTSYDTPASLAAISGTYSGSTRTASGNAPVVYSIGLGGALTGSSTVGSATCTFSGAISPRSNGKNVYNLSITFTSSACARNGQTLSGVAVPATINASKYLYAIGLNADRSDGFLVLSTKQ